MIIVVRIIQILAKVPIQMTMPAHNIQTYDLGNKTYQTTHQLIQLASGYPATCTNSPLGTAGGRASLLSPTRRLT